MAIAIVAICGFVALAVDIGMLAIAHSQCQNAADAAAVAAARTLDGTSAGNLSQATSNALLSASKNTILGRAIQNDEVSIRHGAYHYNSATQKFAPQFPPGAYDNSLSEVTITHSYRTGFARVIGYPTLTVTAKSTAAHRPRDVAIVLDYSGSMNNESDLWNCEGYLGSFNNTSNNTDPIFPQFGPYSPSFSPLAVLQCTANDPMVGKCNVTQSVLGIPCLINDLFQNARGSSGTGAFSAAPLSITNTSPGGDQYRNKLNTTTPAKNWQEITGSSSTAFTGYAAAQAGVFNGYTRAAGYWGKTFFIWPPDPTTTGGVSNDWRKKFFKLTSGAACNDNTKLWTSGGAWQDPPSNYIINYAAILNWIKTKGPNPFPSVLRAGNVLYYDQIPDDVPASAYTHTNSNSQIGNANQRFWKEYIDFTIGVWRDPFGNIQHPASPSCSYGGDFTCGSSSAGSGVQITGPDAAGPGGTVWIAPLDNPKRPRHRLWFGPMTMVQYMLDTGLLPGTANDISMISAKLGISGALLDIQNNHPNDLVSLIMFSRPPYSGEPAEAGEFAQPQVLLSRDYTALQRALWYPPNSSTADVRPWDPNGLQTPRAHGDYCGNTATSYGLMLAYNQFSSSMALALAGAGGQGRKGAQKLVILETDGMANVSSSVGTTNGGSYNSFYNVPPIGSATTSGTSPDTDAINIARRICALDTDASPIAGYSTTRNPVQIQCIAFGAIFEPTASGSEQSGAVSLLQNLSSIGHTVFPTSATDPTDGYKWCIGSLFDRQEKLRQAFINAMDNDVSIVLVPNAP